MSKNFKNVVLCGFAIAITLTNVCYTMEDTDSLSTMEKGMTHTQSQMPLQQEPLVEENDLHRENQTPQINEIGEKEKKNNQEETPNESWGSFLWNTTQETITLHVIKKYILKMVLFIAGAVVTYEIGKALDTVS